MTKKGQSRFTTEDKLSILSERFLKQIPVADLCEKHKMHPSLFYKWQNTLFENGAIALERKKSGHNENLALKKAQSEIEALKRDIQQKESVLADLMCEHIALKKSLTGES
jgi:transposase